MSAASSKMESTARNTKTMSVNGVSVSTSIGRGFGRRRIRANVLRKPSIAAIAICPPSSGRSGNKLKIPTKILRLAMIRRKVAIRSFQASDALPAV